MRRRDEARPTNGRDVEIVVLLDRSGSMETIRDDMVQGYGAFMREQAKAPGKSRVTLVQFDSQGTETVYESADPAKVGPLELVPRGGTPLLDAMGKTINDTGARLGSREKKPDGVIFIVITDGEENQSRTFTKPQVRALVESRTAAGWVFSYIGANVDAFKEGGGLGIQFAGLSNYIPDSAGVQHAFRAVACAATAYSGGGSYTVNNIDPRLANQGNTGIATYMGSLGGASGGAARAASLSPDERSNIARKAANARWKNEK